VERENDLKREGKGEWEPNKPSAQTGLKIAGIRRIENTVNRCL